MGNPRYIKANVYVKNWESAKINGKEDESGENVPFKSGDNWSPVIDLQSGMVLDWPEGMIAEFYFKVVDMGSYYLLDDNKNIIAEIIENYVPTDFLCYGSEGYGDYIIFNVDGSGKIENYSQVDPEPDEWSEPED